MFPNCFKGGYCSFLDSVAVERVCQSVGVCWGKVVRQVLYIRVPVEPELLLVFKSPIQEGAGVSTSCEVVDVVDTRIQGYKINLPVTRFQVFGRYT